MRRGSRGWPAYAAVVVVLALGVAAMADRGVTDPARVGRNSGIDLPLLSEPPAGTTTVTATTALPGEQPDRVHVVGYAADHVVVDLQALIEVPDASSYLVLALRGDDVVGAAVGFNPGNQLIAPRIDAPSTAVALVSLAPGVLGADMTFNRASADRITRTAAFGELTEVLSNEEVDLRDPPPEVVMLAAQAADEVVLGTEFVSTLGASCPALGAVLIDEPSLCVVENADGTWEVRNPTIEWMLAYPVPSDGVPCAVIGGGAVRPETVDPEQPNRFQIEPIPQTATPALDCDQAARLFSPGTSATGSIPSREVLATTALAVFATHTAPLAEILHGSVDSPLTPDEVAEPEGLAARLAAATDSGNLRDLALPVVAEVPSSAGAFGRLSYAMLEAPTLVPRARTDDPYRAIMIELLGRIADEMETTPSLLTSTARERGPISPPN